MKGSLGSPWGRLANAVRRPRFLFGGHPFFKSILTFQDIGECTPEHCAILSISATEDISMFPERASAAFQVPDLELMRMLWENVAHRVLTFSDGKEPPSVFTHPREIIRTQPILF